MRRNAPLAEGGYLSARQDLFTLLRELERLSPDQPCLGEVNDNSLSRLRIIQVADTAFAPSELMAVTRTAQRVELLTRYFGFFAPYGPLPIHMTEHARSEALLQRNRAFQSFVAIFSQRLAVLNYRAWSQLNPVVNHDRPVKKNAFLHRLGQVAGITRLQDDAHDVRQLRLTWPGAWLPGRGSVSELQRMLSDYYAVPIRIALSQGMWIEEATQQNQMGQLGATRLGQRFFDAQYGVRVVIGPLSAPDYQVYQRGEPRLHALARSCQDFFRHQYAIEIRLLIRTSPDMACRLGQGKTGRSGWLKAREGIVPQSVWYSAT